MVIVRTHTRSHTTDRLLYTATKVVDENHSRKTYDILKLKQVIVLNQISNQILIQNSRILCKK